MTDDRRLFAAEGVETEDLSKQGEGVLGGCGFSQ